MANADRENAPREDRWLSSLGGCITCGAPLYYPTQQENTILRKRSTTETLLFKYGLAQRMLEGSLLGNGLLEDIMVITPVKLKELNLRVDSMWSQNDSDTLERYVAHARESVFPTCHDCDSAGRQVGNEMTIMFYGMLKHAWFFDSTIPYSTTANMRVRPIISDAHALQAIFAFFTLESAEAGATDIVKAVRKRLPGPLGVRFNRPSREQRREQRAAAKGLVGKLVRSTMGTREYYGKATAAVTERGTSKPLLRIRYTDGSEQLVEPGFVEKNMIQRSILPSAVTPLLDRMQVRIGSSGSGGGGLSGLLGLTSASVAAEDENDSSDSEEDDNNTNNQIQLIPSDPLTPAFADPSTLASHSAPHPSLSTPGVLSGPTKQDATETRTRSGSWGSLLDAINFVSDKSKAGNKTETDDAETLQEKRLYKKTLRWRLKTKIEIWRDYCVLRTISHLMLWGSTKHGRHRILAVFWSAYYLWIRFVSEEDQGNMEFRVWFTHVFREYYMHTFPSNTWFTHDVLAIAQFTNLNTSMHQDWSKLGVARDWVEWTRLQLDTMAPDVEALNKWVFLGDASQLRSSKITDYVSRRETIREALDVTRERVSDVPSLYAVVNNGSGLSIYFGWYLFSMRGTKFVQQNVTDFISEYSQSTKSSSI